MKHALESPLSWIANWIRDHLFAAGVWATVLYSGFLAVLRWPFHLSTLRNMQINELGDTLTGLAGPLALMWLVLGFLQQGAQIGNSARALENQADKLGDMVEATQQSVALNQAAIEKGNVQRSLWDTPALDASAIQDEGVNSEGRRYWMFHLAVKRAKIDRLEFRRPPHGFGIHSALENLSPGSVVKLGWGPVRTGPSRIYPKNQTFPKGLMIEAHFSNEAGEEFRQRLVFHESEKGELSAHAGPVELVLRNEAGIEVNYPIDYAESQRC